MPLARLLCEATGLSVKLENDANGALLGKVFARGKEILLLSTGGEKAHLLPMLTNQQVTTHIPFTLLKLHPNCTCLIDRSAFDTGCSNNEL